MPQVSASAVVRHGQQTALERLRRLSCAGLDVAGFLRAVNPIVGQVVPNGTHTIDAPFWYTLDPESHLVTSIIGEGCDVDAGEYMQWELLADDVMKTADVLSNPRGVQTLHEVTDGHPERSAIYVEVMVPHGMAQELLVALRSASGENWGTARMNRSPDEPMFSAHEVKFMAAVAPVIADGVQRGLLVGEAIEPELPDAPGLVVLGADGDIELLSPRVQEWFARLPDDDGRRDGVPTCVLAAATSAMRDAERHGAGGESRLRVPMTDGTWAVVHGAYLDTRVTVIIEQAHPDRVAPLLMSIYGLTARERDVTQHVLRGGSTAELARSLGVSPHTFQQHLKSIFEKTDVKSRGELVAKIFFDCYHLRTRDNRTRILDDRPVRGGAKAAVNLVLHGDVPEA